MNQKSTLISILRIGTTTLLAGVLSYVYHPLMLQFMSVETFGEFSSMLGVFNILGVLTAGIGLFLMPKIAQQRGNHQDIVWLYQWAFPRGMLLGLVAGVLFLLAVPFLQNYLHLPYRLPLVLIGGSVVLTFPATVLSAFVQGMERFTFLGVNGILWWVFKLVIGFALAYCGYGVYAAIGGLVWAGVLSFVLVWTYVFWLLRPYQFKKTQKLNLDQSFVSEFWSFFHAVLLALLLAFFMNSDLIMVRNLFDAQQAGIYGGIAVVGKFIIYVLAAIETVYYPKLTQYSSAQQVPFAWIKNPLLLFLLAGLGAMLGSWILGEKVLWLMKPELAGQVGLLLLVVLSGLLYGVFGFYAKVLIARGDKKVNYSLAIGAITLLGVFYFLPPLSLEQYTLSFAAVEFVLLIYLLRRIYILRKSNEK